MNCTEDKTNGAVRAIRSTVLLIHNSFFSSVEFCVRV